MADEELEYPERGYNTKDVRAQPVSEPPRRRRRGWLWKVLAVLVAGPAVILGLWTVITLMYTYSRGERVGYVQKFSEKGWVCKTWEGELALSTVPGSAPQLFQFSVREDAVARKIEEVMRTQDGRVSISYAQHKGVPTSCFGETEYYVTDARPVGPSGATAAPGLPGSQPGTGTAPVAPPVAPPVVTPALPPATPVPAPRP